MTLTADISQNFAGFRRIGSQQRLYERR